MIPLEVAEHAVCPKLRLIAAFLVCSISAHSAADKTADYQRRWAGMVYVEDAIREIDGVLARLEKSLLDLQLPTRQARSYFVAELPLGDIVSLDPDGNAVLETHIRSWGIGESRKRTRDELQIWQAYLESLSYLKNAEFYVIDGQFSDARRLNFVAEVAFSGLGRTTTGLSHASAKVELTFTRDDLNDSDWRISSWSTLSFQTKRRRQLMFEDVLDELVSAPTAASLRRSLHEEIATNIISGQTVEEKLQRRPYPEFDISSWTRHPGLSVVDYNDDGLDDLFITRRTGNQTLLRNRGDGSFEQATDQPALTSNDEVKGFTNTAFFADFDNDGDQDAFVGRSLRRSRYYQNDSGTFKYSPNLISIPLPAHVVSISAVDYNNDGLLDVYLSRYMPTANGFEFDMTKMKKRGAIAKLFKSNRPRLARDESREFAQRTWAAQTDLFRDAPGVPNMLLKNIGDGHFVPAPEGKTLQVWRPTYQSTWGDYDGDGDSDVYIANDFSPNHLFRNDKTHFTDVTASTGTADNGFGMGASWGDYDGDGLLDLYVTNMASKAGRRITTAMGPFGEQFSAMAQGNSLFRQMDGKFIRTSGHTPDKLGVELAGWGWGSQFMDIDNDGDLDIFAPSGYYTAPAAVRTSVDT